MDHAYYLQAMGIQQWVRRERESESVSAVAESEAESEFSELVEEQGEPTTPLLVLTSTLGEEEQHLLSAMLQAIDVDANRVHRLIVSDQALFSQELFQHYLMQRVDQATARSILQLGGERVNHPLVTLIHHPAHLLQHPEEKRAAWEALKRVRQLIAVV